MSGHGGVRKRIGVARQTSHTQSDKRQVLCFVFRSNRDMIKVKHFYVSQITNRDMIKVKHFYLNPLD